MAYDELSFLNGLAAGLSVTGGQRIDGQIPPGSYGVIYSLFGRTDGRYRLTLSMEAEKQEGQFVFVNWGDGTISKYSTPGNFDSSFQDMTLLFYHEYERQYRSHDVYVISNAAITPGSTRRNTPAVAVNVGGIYGANLERSGATEIITNAFRNCEKLRDVILPDGLITISASAFTGSGIGSVYPKSVAPGPYNILPGGTGYGVLLPDSLTALDDYAFYGCNNLERINIPDTVVAIGKGAFSNCGKLQSFNSQKLGSYTYRNSWPSHIPIIDDDMFCNCRKLLSMMIPEGVTRIGNRAFSDCGGGKGLFTSSYFEEPECAIPVSVQSIGDCAFDLSGDGPNISWGDGSVGESYILYYKGSTEQWITALGDSRLTTSANNAFTIYCANGSILYRGNVMQWMHNT